MVIIFPEKLKIAPVDKYVDMWIFPCNTKVFHIVHTVIHRNFFRIRRFP